MVSSTIWNMKRYVDSIYIFFQCLHFEVPWNSLRSGQTFIETSIILVIGNCSLVNHYTPISIDDDRDAVYWRTIILSCCLSIMDFSPHQTAATNPIHLSVSHCILPLISQILKYWMQILLPHIQEAIHFLLWELNSLRFGGADSYHRCFFLILESLKNILEILFRWGHETPVNRNFSGLSVPISWLRLTCIQLTFLRILPWRLPFSSWWLFSPLVFTSRS